MILELKEKNNNIELETNVNFIKNNKDFLNNLFSEINDNELKNFSEILSLKINILENGETIVKSLKNDVDKQNISGDEKKELKLKIEKDVKSCQTFHLCQVLGDKFYDYLIYTNKIFNKMIDFEKNRAFDFLTNKEEAEKAGWFIKNPKPLDLIIWAEKAYPNFNINLWESKIDLQMLKSYILIKNL